MKLLAAALVILVAAPASAGLPRDDPLDELLERYARMGPEQALRAASARAILSEVDGIGIDAAQRIAWASPTRAGDAAFEIARRALDIVPPTGFEAHLALAHEWAPSSDARDLERELSTTRALLTSLGSEDAMGRLRLLLHQEGVQLAPIDRSPDLVSALAALGPVEDEVRTRLAGLPPDMASALTEVVDAHRWQRTLTPDILAAPLAQRTDLARMVDLAIAGSVAKLAPVLECGWGVSDGRPYYYLELDCTDTTYTDDIEFAIDVGGQDTYRNNAGGSALFALSSAAMLLDMAGDDRYFVHERDGGLVGGGYFGSGFHWDDSGADHYEVNLSGQGAALGSSLGGSGFHADLSGSDVRIVRSLIDTTTTALGSTFAGAAVFLDMAGDDVYRTEGVDTTIGASNIGDALFLDHHGNDTYEALGANVAIGSTNLGSTRFLEIGGSDRYNVSGARYSMGGSAGSALFVDDGGDDQATVESSAPIVAAFAGTADAGQVLFLDTAGADQRSVSGGLMRAFGAGSHAAFVDQGGSDGYAVGMGAGEAFGAGLGGTSTFVDVLGDDTYDVEQTHVLYLDPPSSIAAVYACSTFGVGALGGTGLFVDTAGRDRYRANFLRNASGFGASGLGGTGLMIEGEGNDSYEISGGESVQVLGTSSAGQQGILLDLGGHDVYRSVLLPGSNFTSDLQAIGAAYAGIGLLFDHSGNDHYEARVAGDGLVNGAGYFGGIGVLVDAGGSDVYIGEVSSGAANGAGDRGVGLLVDSGGTNEFTSRVPPNVPNLGAALGQKHVVQPVEIPLIPALGILLAGPGPDAFYGEGLTQGAGASAVGILLDAGGANEFASGADARAQGAADDFGVGILVDHGASSAYALGERSIGQGAGLQGLGMLIRTADAGVSSYFAGPASRPSSIDGAGAGIRLDPSAASFAGVLPNLECVAPEDEIDRRDIVVQGELVATLRTCKPNEQTSHLTILGNITKPRCSAVPFCSPLVEVLYEDQEAWLEDDRISGTTSGGLKLVYAATGLEPAAPLQATYEVQSADRVCRMSCFALEQA